MARIKPGVFSWEDVLAQRYQTNKPTPLRRRRPITLTIDTPAQQEQEQQQCRLLSLSPELRLMIWESALGGLRLHIIQRTPKRLGYIICPLRATEHPDILKPQPQPHAGNPFCEICHGGGIPQPAREADLVRARGNGGGKLLALALTCRQISLESTHLLYTLNTFEFSNPWTLPYLRPTLPLESWESIRSIELRWSFPGHWLPTKDPVRAIYVSAGRAQWLETCLALTRLPALRSFVLVLGSNWFNEPVEKLPIFLEPLRELRVLPRHCAWDVSLLKRGLLDVDASSGESGVGIPASGGGGAAAAAAAAAPTASCACVRPLVSAGAGVDISTPLVLSEQESLGLLLPTWELRLQGQPYYLHELGRVGDDLRRRGIDCAISTM